MFVTFIAKSAAGFIARKFGSTERRHCLATNGGGDMVAELDVLSQWIPEQMLPGTIFVLENAGRVGEKDDELWSSKSTALRHHYPISAENHCAK